jgi:hypothetical protein
MQLDAFLATIIIVSFLITIVMAVGSYGAYKLRERRRPMLDSGAADGGRPFFVRVDADDFDDQESPVRRA